MIAHGWPLAERHGMKGRQMRWLIYALAAVGFAQCAYAGDFDILRGTQSVGPATFTNWSGYYVGGQWGVTDGNADFSKAATTPVGEVVSQTAVNEDVDPLDRPYFSTADRSAMGYGAFAGYNAQWQDLILGFEGNYVHTPLVLNAPTNPTVYSDLSDGKGNTYHVGVTASGTLSDIDYGSLRGRAGVILGDVLPYGFVGAVVGMANLNISAQSQGTCDAGSNVNCAPFSFTATSGKTPTWLYGGSIGAGIDYALTQHFFLRAEYEYIRFLPVSDTVIAISSARIGAGFKF